MPESMLLAAAARRRRGGARASACVLLLRRIVRARRRSSAPTPSRRPTRPCTSRPAAAKHLRGGLDEVDAAAGRPAPAGAARLRRASRSSTAPGARRRSTATTPCARVAGASSRPRPIARRAGRSVQRRASRSATRETRCRRRPDPRPATGPVGAIVAFAPPVRAGLVRATGEVADWVAAQVELRRARRLARRTRRGRGARAARADQPALHLQLAERDRVVHQHRPGPGARARARVRRLHPLLVPPRTATSRPSPRSCARSTATCSSSAPGSATGSTVTLQIAPEVLSTVVPFLSIQPLVENAVRHGLESKEGGGRITITRGRLGRVRRDHRRGRRRRHRPRGARDGARRATRTGEHVGLRNVDARLRQVYGDEHGLVVETERRRGHAGAHAGAEVAAGPCAASADVDRRWET